LQSNLAFSTYCIYTGKNGQAQLACVDIQCWIYECKALFEKKPEGHYFLIRHIMLLRLSMVIPQKTILYELQNKN